MDQPRPFFRRKSIYLIAFFLLAINLLILFRFSLSAKATEYLLSKRFGQNFSCKNICAKEKRIVIEDLHIEREGVGLNLNEASFSFSLGKVLTKPGKVFALLSAENRKNILFYLAAMQDYGISLEVEKGSLELENDQFPFHFEAGDRVGKLGALSLFHDEKILSHPFLHVQFAEREDQLLVQMQMEPISTQRFLALATGAFPNLREEWRDGEGLVECSLSTVFGEEGNLIELSTRLGLQNFSATHASLQMQVHAKHLEAEFSYPEGAENAGLPIWKQVRGALSVKGGDLQVGDRLAFSQLEGSIGLDPRVDPNMHLTGEIQGPDAPLAMELIGKGAAHDDHVYWLEFGLGIDNQKGTQCGAFVSVCSPEEETLVLQFEANDLFPAQVEMLQKYFTRFLPRMSDWQIVEGNFGGKLVTLFEKGKLSHFELQEVMGTNVVLRSDSFSGPLRLETLRAEGRLAGENALGDLTLDVDLATEQLLEWPFPALRSAYASYSMEDRAHLCMTLKMGQTGVETLCAINLPDLDQSLQFGFRSPSSFPKGLEDVQDAWLRSNKLNHNFYAPFVRLISPDLEMYGDVDFLATYTGKEVELALQINDLTVKTLPLDLQCQAIGLVGEAEGRIRASVDLKTNKWKVNIPLQNAKIFEKQEGLFFTDLSADLDLLIEDGKAFLSGKVEKGGVQFDGKPLLKDLRFSLTLSNESLTLQKLDAHLAFASDKPFQLLSDKVHLSKKLVDARFSLLGGGQKLADVALENGRGKVFLHESPIRGEFGIAYSWNGFEKALSAYLQGEKVEFFGKKTEKVSWQMRLDPSGLVLEDLRADDLLASLQIRPKGEEYFLEKLQVKTPQYIANASGDFALDIASSTQSFGVRSTLDVETELLAPISLQCKTAHPVKFAYCPKLGTMLADLELETGQSRLSVEHLESLKQHLTVRGIHFAFSDELVSELFDAEVLPPVFRDFVFCKHFAGELNLSSQEGKTVATGLLREAALWKEEGNRDLAISLEKESSKYTLSLREQEKEEGLTITCRLFEQVPSFTSIRGELGRLSADLKKKGIHELKGTLSLDFTLFSELFDLPINHTLSLWKAGQGYRLDGLFTVGKRITDWGFRGKVRGDAFEFGGYKIRSLEAKAEVSPGQITIENVDITDDAGKMWIGEGAIMQSGPENRWVFHFPLVEIRSFQPSCMEHMHKEKKTDSRLTIKSATLHQVRGQVDAPETITAYGSFRFQCQAKEQELAKNVPIQMLRKLGLEEELFIPAMGNVEIMLRDRRFYVQSITNVFSEQRRSEFILNKGGTMGYLDFDGNLNFDLRVRQQVVSSIRSPLMLTVRGTWNQPQLVVR